MTLSIEVAGCSFVSVLRRSVFCSPRGGGAICSPPPSSFRGVVADAQVLSVDGASQSEASPRSPRGDALGSSAEASPPSPRGDGAVGDLGVVEPHFLEALIEVVSIAVVVDAVVSPTVAGRERCGVIGQLTDALVKMVELPFSWSVLGASCALVRGLGPHAVALFSCQVHASERTLLLGVVEAAHAARTLGAARGGGQGRARTLQRSS